ncbi:MAG: ATP-binding protein [Defluviitaleaceae bacterium]|nr:ATP-binding protein [Defluviitaleaceae bacterium]
MKITNLVKLCIVVFGMLASINIYFSVLVAQANQDMAEAYEVRRTFTVAMHQLQSGSEELTRLARAYIVTGEQSRYNMYWAEIVEVDRIGKAAQIFIDNGAPENELQLLTQILEYSNSNRHMETLAFAALSAGDRQLAIDIVYGEYYRTYGMALNVALENLSDTMFARTQEVVDSTSYFVHVYSSYAMGAIVVFALISVIASILILREVRAAMIREREAAEGEREAIQRQQLMYDATPIPISLWNDKYQVIDCSEAMVNFLALSSKEEALSRFHEFSVDHQPCGTPTPEKIKQVIDEVLQGYKDTVHHIWTYKIGGNAIPTEATFVRIPMKGEFLVACYAQDLRSLMDAGEKMREVDEMNEAFLNSSPFVMSLWDENYKMVETNQQTAALFGIARKEEFIENVYKFMPENQPCGTPTGELVRGFLEKAFNDGRAQMEFMLKTATGDPLPTDITLVRFNSEGKQKLVAFVSDLRPMRAALDKEREAYESSRLFFDASPMLIETWDSAIGLVRCNKQTVNIFGLDSKEDYMRRFLELSPEYQPCGIRSEKKFSGLLQEAYDTGNARSEWVHIKPDGELLPMESHFVRIQQNEKCIVVRYSHDLRKIKKVQEQVQEADERTKLLLSASPLACYLLDENYNVIDLNKACLELFLKESGKPLNYTYEHCDFGECIIDCDNCRRYIHKACLARKYFTDNYRGIFPSYKQDASGLAERMELCGKKAFEHGVQHFEYTHQTLYGEMFSCDVTVVPIEFLEGKVLACYLRDMRDARRRQVAEEESRAKTRFLTRMSHEIRTPLNAIMGVTEIQLQKSGHNPEIEEAFHRVYSSSSMLLTIINDILDLSKVEAGKMEIVPARYELVCLLVDTVQLNLMYVGSKSIDFVIHADENLPELLIGDELRIKQVLTNILSNAFKYTKDGSVTLSVAMEALPLSEAESTHLGEADIMLIFQIEDTGQGMTKEQLDNIFELFVRHNVEENREIEGSGLGMNIAQHLVSMMHGEITAQSQLGVGSTFTVRIPQKRYGSDVLGKEQVESLQNMEMAQKTIKRLAKMTREPMPYGRVLVVDDVESNLYVAKGLLMPYKLAIDTVESGYAVVDKIKSGETYDIIFMDHMMPGMDGLQATKIIRDMGYTYPIVALTANVVKGQSDMFMNNGFSGFIAKPIDLRLLDNCLLRFIRDKQPPEVLEAAQIFAKYVSVNTQSFESSEQMLTGMVEVFLRDAQKVIAKLEPIAKEIEQGNELGEDVLKTYTSQVHGIKAALANVGYPQLSEVAQSLEVAGVSADFETIKMGTPMFLDGMREAIDKLAPTVYQAYGKSEDERSEDRAYLREQLRQIGAACEAYDKKLAKAIMNDLVQRPYSKQTRTLINEINSFLMLSDFDEAAELARKAAKAV